MKAKLVWIIHVTCIHPTCYKKLWSITIRTIMYVQLTISWAYVKSFTKSECKLYENRPRLAYQACKEARVLQDLPSTHFLMKILVDSSPSLTCCLMARAMRALRTSVQYSILPWKVTTRRDATLLRSLVERVRCSSRTRMKISRKDLLDRRWQNCHSPFWT